MGNEKKGNDKEECDSEGLETAVAPSGRTRDEDVLPK